MNRVLYKPPSTLSGDQGSLNSVHFTELDSYRYASMRVFLDSLVLPCEYLPQKDGHLGSPGSAYANCHVNISSHSPQEAGSLKMQAFT